MMASCKIRFNREFVETIVGYEQAFNFCLALLLDFSGLFINLRRFEASISIS